MVALDVRFIPLPGVKKKLGSVKQQITLAELQTETPGRIRQLPAATALSRSNSAPARPMKQATPFHLVMQGRGRVGAGSHVESQLRQKIDRSKK